MPRAVEHRALKKDKSVRKSDCENQDKLNHRADEVVADGHSAEDYGDEDAVENRGHGRRSGHPQEFGIAREAPDALVHAQEPENDYAKYCVNRNKFQKREEITLRNRGVTAVKAEPEREEIRQVYCYCVVNHQIYRDDVPVLQPVFHFLSHLLTSWPSGIPLIMRACGTEAGNGVSEASSAVSFHSFSPNQGRSSKTIEDKVRKNAGSGAVVKISDYDNSAPEMRACQKTACDGQVCY